MYVFGYASLTVLGGRPARASGLRRVWGVAMDNRVEIPGYKVYADPRTGDRPAVHVAFLDVVEDAAAWVDGVLLDVDEDSLEELDARERNFDRVPIEVEGEAAWVYTGSAAARQRFADGLAAGTLVIQAGYAALVGDAEPPPCPVVDLLLIDLKGSDA